MEKMLCILYVLYFILLGNTSKAYVCNIKAECDSLIGNDVCDGNCNNLNCSYDGGDCLLQNDPWSNCDQASICKTAFYIDRCDVICNNEACLYDQFKCKQLFTDDCITNCTNKWGNDVCDSDCDKVQCGYDGNDCNHAGNVIPGTMVVYAKSIIPLASNTARFIGFALSLATRTIVSLKTSLKYNGSVPEIESLGDAGVRVQYVVQNTPDCSTNTYTACWSNIQHVSNYGAAVSIVLNEFLQSIELNVTITKVIACMDGYYGEFCNNTCSVNCKSGCYIFDGTCIDGCVGNYHGDKCDSTCSQNCQLGCISGSTCIGGQCNSGFTGSECTTECSTGTYGPNCAYNCSSGCMNNICSKTDGNCSCKAGYNGTMCERECTDGTYGYYCNTTCGNCIYGDACDKFTGTCLTGCRAGYYGDLCTDVCLDGKHGADCSQNCTNCVNDTCYPVTGSCREGCIDGWTGSDCTTEIAVIDNTVSTTTTITIAIIVVLSVLVGSCLLVSLVLWRRSRKDNYQSHLDTKVVIGERDKQRDRQNGDTGKKSESDSVDTMEQKELTNEHATEL